MDMDVDVDGDQDQTDETLSVFALSSHVFWQVSE